MGQETVRALRGVSFDVQAGEYIAIVGPLGCGKSTLLNLMGVIDQPTSGVVLFGGLDVGSLRDRDATAFRLRNIGFVFQRFYLMPPCRRVRISSCRWPKRVYQPRTDSSALGSSSRRSGSPIGNDTGRRNCPVGSSSASPLRVRSPIGRLCCWLTSQLESSTPERALKSSPSSSVCIRRDRLSSSVTHDDHLAATAARTIQMRDGEVVGIRT